MEKKVVLVSEKWLLSEVQEPPVWSFKLWLVSPVFSGECLSNKVTLQCFMSNTS